MIKRHDAVSVFVYGTLKPGETNYQRYCALNVLSVQRAITFGQLYALPFGYPAMIAGDRPVYGFLLTFANADILAALDRLEGYDSHQPATENEYTRQRIETYNSDLKPLAVAWIYLMTLQQVKAFSGLLLPDGWWSGCGQQNY